MKIQENISLADYTTLKIGGPARYFIDAKTEEELKEAIKFSQEKKLYSLIIGSGSNILVSDAGFDGVVIKNSIGGMGISGAQVWANAGASLQDLVDFTINAGLGGMECLTGIPGTVGGAVYGNAGAYGQTISDYLEKVLVYDAKKDCKLWMSKKRCNFEYRESVFKKRRELVILRCEFKQEAAESQELKEKASKILSIRRQKYPAGIKCPGSFFKNVIAADLPSSVLAKIPQDKIVYGKVPAGYLLEAVGAKGARLGDAVVATYHGNLFINQNQASAKDFYSLAIKYAKKVKEKFGITLEPEVQLVGF
jgi:UDP-N-acetylmuramate dehydrogenase